MATLLELQARLAKTQAPKAQTLKALQAQVSRVRVPKSQVLQIPVDRSFPSSFPSILKPAWRSWTIGDHDSEIKSRRWIRNIDPIARDDHMMLYGPGKARVEFDPDTRNVLMLGSTGQGDGAFYLSFVPSDEDDEHVRRMLRSARPAPHGWFSELFINPDGIAFFENAHKYASLNAGFESGERFLQIPKNERRRMMFDAGLIELHRRHQVYLEGQVADREWEARMDKMYGISEAELLARVKMRKELDAKFAAEFGKWP